MMLKNKSLYFKKSNFNFLNIILNKLNTFISFISYLIFLFSLSSIGHTNPTLQLEEASRNLNQSSRSVSETRISFNDFIKTSSLYKSRIEALADHYYILIREIRENANNLSNLTTKNVDQLRFLASNYLSVVERFEYDLYRAIDNRFLMDDQLLNYWENIFGQLFRSYLTPKIYFIKKGILFKSDILKQSLLEEIWVLNLEQEHSKSKKIDSLSRNIFKLNSIDHLDEVLFLTEASQSIVIDGSFLEIIMNLSSVRTPSGVHDKKIIQSSLGNHLGIFFSRLKKNIESDVQFFNKKNDIIFLNFYDQEETLETKNHSIFEILNKDSISKIKLNKIFGDYCSEIF